MLRSEAKKEFTWATEHLFTNDEAWEKACDEITKYADELASYKGRISTDGEALLEYQQKSEAFNDFVTKCYTYAMFKSDEDKGNSKYQGYLGKVMSLITAVSAKLSFEGPEIVAIPEEKLEEFYKTTEGLEHYRRSISRQRAYKDHTLSEAEETILAASGDLADIPETVASSFVNADLKFPDITDSEGNVRKVTQATFIPLMESSDVNVRKQAFYSVYNTYAGFKNTMASLFDGQVKQLKFYTAMRKFNSNMERALFRTEVPVSVYKNLVKTVNDNLPSLHRYMDLRKKFMGVDELHMYDLYTPLVPEADVKVTYDEAKAFTLEALKPLGEEYLAIVKEAFESRWIDVYENEGKRGGAYSCGTPVHPFILLNHNDTLDAAFTLVHEMGHALHSYLSTKNQSPAYSDYVIFVAEVASTFNEALLMKYLLSKTDDKKKKAYLINHFLEQFRTTLYRQTMFAEFEMEMNEASERGESLTADLLCDIYYKLNKKYYGNNMVVDKEIAYEWERIPHFFMNFYVYQYATGFSAAMALADKVLKEGKSAVDAYINFLSSGRKEDPITLLRNAGVDMESPEPINAALKVFDGLIGEMEQLLAE
jgi:oligoendopeptidase F